MKRWLPLGIFIGLGVVLIIGLMRHSETLPSPLVGKPLPPLPAGTLDGDTFSSSELRGKTWLLNVWASWCRACEEEIDQLLALKNALSLPIIGMAYRDEPDAARRWLARYGNPYTAILSDPSGAYGIEWGVYGVPETFLIDEKGIILHKFIGPIALEDVQIILKRHEDAP